jgi:hypothetical protein
MLPLRLVAYLKFFLYSVESFDVYKTPVCPQLQDVMNIEQSRRWDFQIFVSLSCDGLTGNGLNIQC